VNGHSSLIDQRESGSRSHRVRSPRARPVVVTGPQRGTGGGDTVAEITESGLTAVLRGADLHDRTPCTALVDEAAAGSAG